MIIRVALNYHSEKNNASCRSMAVKTVIGVNQTRSNFRKPAPKKFDNNRRQCTFFKNNQIDKFVAPDL